MIEKSLDQMMAELDRGENPEHFRPGEKAQEIIDANENKALDDFSRVAVYLEVLLENQALTNDEYREKYLKTWIYAQERLGEEYYMELGNRIARLRQARQLLDTIFALFPGVEREWYDPYQHFAEGKLKLPTLQEIQKAEANGFDSMLVVPQGQDFDNSYILNSINRLYETKFKANPDILEKSIFVHNAATSEPRPFGPYAIMFTSEELSNAYPQLAQADSYRQKKEYFEKMQEELAGEGLNMQGINFIEQLLIFNMKFFKANSFLINSAAENIEDYKSFEEAILLGEKLKFDNTALVAWFDRTTSSMILESIRSDNVSSAVLPRPALFFDKTWELNE